MKLNDVSDNKDKLFFTCKYVIVNVAEVFQRAFSLFVLWTSFVFSIDIGSFNFKSTRAFYVKLLKDDVTFHS